MIYEKWDSLKYKYNRRKFWCRGYYIDTEYRNTKAIKEYIQNQLKEDELSAQITMDNTAPFKSQRVKIASGKQKATLRSSQ